MSNGRHPLPAADDLSAQGPQDRPGSWLRELFAPLDHLLVAGGDNRLALDRASRMNAYFCRPLPCPDTLDFASSTATSISLRGYEAAGRARGALMQAAILDGLVGRLRRPHRGDAQRTARRSRTKLRHRSHLLRLRHRRATTGALSRPRSARRLADHFDRRRRPDRQRHGVHRPRPAFRRAHRQRAQSDEGNAARRARHRSIAWRCRCATMAGEIRAAADIDAVVQDAVDRLASRGSPVLLQAMDCSKLGWRAPSDRLLQDIAARWPDQVQIVIDACQMRLSRRRIACVSRLRRFMVLLTGSKYFTGPPFSGALLVPPALARRIAATDLDLAGLRAYNSASDWPRALGRRPRAIADASRISGNGCAGKPRWTKSPPTTRSPTSSGASRSPRSARGLPG